jgi:endonuclease/exonuclease/phosphatase family metal-dependent hydrolase
MMIHDTHKASGKTNSAKVKFATFNTQNLALAKKYFYPGQHYSLEEYEQKIQWTAGQLRTMNADIVGFQEVFDLEALTKSVQLSGAYKNDYFINIAESKTYQPCVALLSRYPVLDCKYISDFPSSALVEIDGQALPYRYFHRPILQARILLPGNVESLIMVVHLKSKRPLLNQNENRHDERDEARGQLRSLLLRASEAVALRHLVLESIQNSETPLILLGDFNDAGHAVSSDILQGRLPQRNYPADVKRKLWDVLLYSCADIQMRRSYKDVYYTHLHNSRYESLDHILVSQEFLNENPRHIATVEYMRLYNDHLLDPALSDERPPVWQSDHGQVLVEIKMKSHT